MPTDNKESLCRRWAVHLGISVVTVSRSGETCCGRGDGPRVVGWVRHVRRPALEASGPSARRRARPTATLARAVRLCRGCTRTWELAYLRRMQGRSIERASSAGRSTASTSRLPTGSDHRSGRALGSLRAQTQRFRESPFGQAPKCLQFDFPPVEGGRLTRELASVCSPLLPWGGHVREPGSPQAGRRGLGVRFSRGWGCSCIPRREVERNAGRSVGLRLRSTGEAGQPARTESGRLCLQSR